MVYAQVYLLIVCFFLIGNLLLDIHSYSSPFSLLIIGKEELCQSMKRNCLISLAWPVIPILLFWPEGD